MLESMVVLMVKMNVQYLDIFSRLALQATIVTVRELKQSISDGESNETFIVQCFLTHFDVDGPLTQLITKRW